MFLPRYHNDPCNGKYLLIYENAKYYANLFLASFTTFITLKKEYFFLVDWFPVAPISDDWLGKDGVLPAEIVFLIQEEADEAGEPNGDTHEDEPKKR